VERTRDLAASNAALQQVQRQLVKSEKLAAIGQIAASVAHEINNPIAVIQGNLDLMREALGAHAAPVRVELRLLDQQVDRMRLIVTQLLQYARPTEYAGYVDAVDVNRAIDGALLLVGHLLSSATIRVARDTAAQTRAGINPQELQQVLINLLTNALQAMPQGGCLWLTTADQVDDKGRSGVLLEVGDSGDGLDGQAHARLFQPFFTTKADGNGLGLWISIGLVERYGGNIRGENWRDRGIDRPGAVFSVWLLRDPVVPDPADDGPALLTAGAGDGA
jgi:two-component system, NtrC family, sensor kinase